MNIFVTSLKGHVGVLLKNYIIKKKYTLIRYNNFMKFNNIDIVIHNGASTPSKSFFKIFYSNFLRNIFLIIRLNKKNIKKFFFFSSISVYGKTINGNINENTKGKKISFYGKSKYFGEYLFLKFLKCPVMCLRLPAILSKNNNDHFFGKLFDKLKNNQNVEINNYKKKFNSLISIDNLFSFIFEKQINFKKDIINLSIDNNYTLIKIIKLLKKKLNSSSRIIISNRKTNHYTLNIFKAKKKYHFRPYSLKKTLNKWINLEKK